MDAESEVGSIDTLSEAPSSHLTISSPRGQTINTLLDENLLVGVTSDSRASVEILLVCGADANIVGPNGNTLLHITAAEGHAEVASLLLRNGANVAARNDTQQTPAMLARANGYANVADLLVEHAFNIAPQQTH